MLLEVQIEDCFECKERLLGSAAARITKAADGFERPFADEGERRGRPEHSLRSQRLRLELAGAGATTDRLVSGAADGAVLGNRTGVASVSVGLVTCQFLNVSWASQSASEE